MRKSRLSLSFVLAALLVLEGGGGSASFAAQMAAINHKEAKHNPVEITRGEKYPVCLELKQILNRPENKQAIGWRTQTKDIIFPASYKHFEPVTWTPITYEKAKESFAPGYLDKVLAEYKNLAVNVEKDWDGSGEYRFEQAQVDFDNHPPMETIIRFKFPGMGKGNCLLTKDAPEPERSAYNIREDLNYHGAGEACEFFKYKNRYYGAYTKTLGYMDIEYPRSAAGYDNGVRWYVVQRDVCTLKVK